MRVTAGCTERRPPHQTPCRAITGVSSESKPMVRARFSTSSTAPIAQILSQSSWRLTTAVNGTTGSSGVFGPPVIGHGTIFRVDPATRTVTTRYRFSGPDGSNPLGRLIQGSDGLIYGTTVSGGASDAARSSRSTPRAHSRPCTTLQVPMAGFRALGSLRDSTAVSTGQPRSAARSTMAACSSWTSSPAG